MVDGTVVRTFRGGFPPGSPMSVQVICGVVEPMPGPTVYFDRNSLVQFTHLELHLDTSGRPAGHGAGIVGMAAPTDTMAYQFDC